MSRAAVLAVAVVVGWTASALDLPDPMALVPGAAEYTGAHHAAQRAQHRAALEQFQAVIDAGGPLAPYARIRAARVLHAAGQSDEAMAQLEGLIAGGERGPWVRMAHAELAGMLATARRYADAARHYEQVTNFSFGTEEHLADIRPWWFVSVARAAARNRIDQNPNDPNAYGFFRDLAEHTFFSGPRREAAEALQRSPLLSDRLLAGWCMVRGGDGSGAARMLLAAMAATGNDAARFGTATPTEAGYFTQLLIERRGVPAGMQVRPEQTWLHLTIAFAINLYANRGDFAEAEQLVALLLPAAGDSRASGDALMWLGDAYRDKGRRADAIRTYERLVEACPTHRMVDRALLAAGEIHAEAGNHDAAIAAWDRLVTLRPEDRTVGAVWFAKGQLFESLGQSERARDAYQRGATWRPADFMAHRSAERLATLGDARALSTQHLRLDGASSFLRPLPVDKPVVPDRAAPLRGDMRYLRLKFFGEIGVPEGEWEALDLVLTPPNGAWELGVFPALAEAGFAHTAGQLADARNWGRNGDRPLPERLKLDLPLIHWRHVTALAREMDIDPYLILAVARQESTFRPALTSHAGASGIMQVMPSTATWLADVDSRVSATHAQRLMDPYSSLRMGAVYIRRMLNSWDGDIVKALASYNAGPGNVRRWVNQRPGQRTEAFIESIPFAETKDYVKRVTANYAAYYTLYGPPPSVAAR